MVPCMEMVQSVKVSDQVTASHNIWFCDSLLKVSGKTFSLCYYTYLQDPQGCLMKLCAGPVTQ